VRGRGGLLGARPCRAALPAALAGEGTDGSVAAQSLIYAGEGRAAAVLGAATRIRLEAEAEAAGDLGSSSARRERTGGGSDHLWWGRSPSLPPPLTRGDATKGEDADAASASRLEGELVARVAAAAAAACRSSAMAPPRGVRAAGAAASSFPLLLPPRRR